MRFFNLLAIFVISYIFFDKLLLKLIFIIYVFIYSVINILVRKMYSSINYDERDISMSLSFSLLRLNEYF